MDLIEYAQIICKRLNTSTLGKQIIAAWDILKNDKETEYFVRRHSNQFLGTISINDLNNRNMLGPFAPSLLQEEVFNLFLFAHLQLVDMNKKCLSPLDAVLSGYSNVVDPYPDKKMEVDKKYQFEKMFTDEEIKELTNLLSKTEPVTFLEKVLPSFKGQDITAWKVPLGIFLQKICGVGPMKCPPEFVGLSFTGPGKVQAETVLKITFASTALRMIQLILNQLIFQSLIYGEMLVLDSNSVIEIKSSSHGIGEGYEALCVCSGMELMICDPGRVVQIKIPDRHIETLAYLEGTGMEMSEETGTLKKMVMRKINADLNPFTNILR